MTNEVLWSGFAWEEEDFCREEEKIFLQSSSSFEIEIFPEVDCICKLYELSVCKR